jgi:hypothetical protein
VDILQRTKVMKIQTRAMNTMTGVDDAVGPGARAGVARAGRRAASADSRHGSSASQRAVMRPPVLRTSWEAVRAILLHNSLSDETMQFQPEREFSNVEKIPNMKVFGCWGHQLDDIPVQPVYREKGWPRGGQADHNPDVQKVDLLFFESEKESCDAIRKVAEVNELKLPKFNVSVVCERFVSSGTNARENGDDKAFRSWAATRSVIDVFDMDCQGCEYDMIPKIEDILNSKVRRVIIGVHEPGMAGVTPLLNAGGMGTCSRNSNGWVGGWWVGGGKGFESDCPAILKTRPWKWQAQSELSECSKSPHFDLGYKYGPMINHDGDIILDNPRFGTNPVLSRTTPIDRWRAARAQGLPCDIATRDALQTDKIGWAVRPGPRHRLTYPGVILLVSSQSLVLEDSTEVGMHPAFVCTLAKKLIANVLHTRSYLGLGVDTLELMRFTFVT